MFCFVFCVVNTQGWYYFLWLIIVLFFEAGSQTCDPPGPAFWVLVLPQVFYVCPQLKYFIYKIRPNIFFIILSFRNLVCNLILCYKWVRMWRKDPSSGIFFWLEESTRSQVPGLLPSLLSWECLPHPTLTLLFLCLFASLSFPFGNSVASYNLPSPG